MEAEFWNDGSVWVGQPDCDESIKLAEYAVHELNAKDFCFFQTSGSEGRRKWVGLTKEALLISAKAVNAHYNITENDHWLLALPVHHVGGFGVLARAYVSESRVTRFTGKWNAEAFVRKCTEAGATFTSLVPTQVFDLVATSLHAPKSMRTVLVGGGALSFEIEAEALRLGWPVRRTYGMTETASQIASQRVEGGEMEVLPIWDLSIETNGALTVRGNALASGYAAFESGKWQWESISPETGLRTRDRVELDQDGIRQKLRFLGRESGIVKILGELVSLAPIQERIDSLRLKLGLQGSEAVVCDLPDARKEARLVLAVSQMCDADAGRLQKNLNATLRPFEHLEEIRKIDSIPRSDLGKVQMDALRAKLA